MTMNKMLIKLDNAHADIRRHEDELRRLGRECAPMVHGHPSIRRRIKNDLQPQINKLNQEIRSLKEANGATSSAGLERHALHEMQKQIGLGDRILGLGLGLFWVGFGWSLIGYLTRILLIV